MLLLDPLIALPGFSPQRIIVLHISLSFSTPTIMHILSHQINGFHLPFSILSILLPIYSLSSTPHVQTLSICCPSNFVSKLSDICHPPDALIPNPVHLHYFQRESQHLYRYHLEFCLLSFGQCCPKPKQHCWVYL